MGIRDRTPHREAKGEAMRRNREREQGAYLIHTSTASSPGLRCAPAGRRRLSEREERTKNREIGRVRPSERIRMGNFFTCAWCVAPVSLVPRHSFHPLCLTRGPYQGWERAGLIFRGRLSVPDGADAFRFGFAPHVREGAAPVTGGPDGREYSTPQGKNWSAVVNSCRR